MYLVHAHADICIPTFWQTLGTLSLRGHIWFPLYQLALIAAIFVVCVVAELGRRKLFHILRVGVLADWLQTIFQKHLHEESV